MVAIPADPRIERHILPRIRALQAYTPGEQINHAIKLNTNECPWGPSPRVRQALSALADDSLRLYPDPLCHELCAAAARRYEVPKECIIAGNGSDDCLTMLYRSLVEPGARVAVPWPTYGLYDTLANIQGSDIVHVDFIKNEDGWHLPEALALQGANLVLVANPNNPSGTMVPVDELRRLAERIDGILVVDEAYGDFACAQDSSCIPYLDRHPNLVVLRTFSKSASLAGARLGLLFAQPAIIQALLRVKDSYNVNAISQALGIAALEDQAHLDQLVDQTLTQRDRLEAACAELGWTWPQSEANFLLVHVGPEAEDCYRYCKEHGILVRWWNKPELREHLRITVGTADNQDRLIACLQEWRQ